MRKQPKPPHVIKRVGKCRDCGDETKLPRAKFFRAATPRCTACGGVIDPVAPLFKHVKHIIKPSR